MKKSLIILSILLLSTAVFGQSYNFIPLPKEVNYTNNQFTIDKNTVVVTTNKESNFNNEYLLKHIAPIFDFELKSATVLPSNNYILLNIEEGYGKEEYKIEVSENSAILSASTQAGLFYACQTFLQLMPEQVYSGDKIELKEYNIKTLTIDDTPRFEYRGAMLDVARTFYDKEYILKYIDWLAYHKINKFHWHLTDDTGWRIEIKKYPELTNKGAWRGENEVIKPAYSSGKDRNGGFYTQKEIKEVIAYAADRNIEIIPEIEMPGHSRAVAATYPEILCNTTEKSISANGEISNAWCVGKESNFKMLENIIKEIAKLFPSDYIHIAGDEINMIYWKNCPDCQALMEKEGMKKEVELHNYFVKRIEKIINKHNKKMTGWDEILDGGELNPGTMVYAWRNMKKGAESVNRGHKTVMQIGEYCYLDMKQSELERGHNWAAIVTLERMYSFDPLGSFNFTQEQNHLIVGPQAALWTELMQYPPRFAEYQMFPRLCALAEIGWTPQEKREFSDFKNRLNDAHFLRLENMGIKFRVEPPKVVYKNNKLMVESPYPAAVVRYTMDGSDPKYTSAVLDAQIITNHPEEFRFATFFGNENQSITVTASNIEIYSYPETNIETNLTAMPRFPMSNANDLNPKTYARTDRRVVEGDYITYNFATPVKCKEIVVETGIPNISFYGVTEGYIEYSYDGNTYIKGDKFVKGVATIKNIEKEIQSVKIVITDENDGYTLAIQEIKIIK